MNACATNNRHNSHLENALSILIVDDDIDLANSLKDMLEIEYPDAKVETANSVNQTHQFIRTSYPDVVLIDIKLGKDNGLDLVPFIKKAHPHSACIMMTAFRETELAIKALRVGADEYILKPIEPAALFKTITTLQNQKHIERERDELDKRFRTLFEESFDIYFLLDDTGTIVDVNQTGVHTIGLPKEDIAGKNITRGSWWRIKDLDAEALRNSVSTALKGQTSLHELSLNSPENKIRFFEFSFKPIPDANNNISLILAEGHDITERKYYEERLNTLNRDLEERVQMRTVALERASKAKSDFLSRMSHELRTPLNIILGYTQILQMDKGSSFSEEDLDCLREIQVAGDHLLDLVNDVLDLTRIEKNKLSLDLHAINLANMIPEVAGSLTLYAQSRGKSITVHTTDDIYVMGDTTRLRQVLVNLVNNAINYGGDITIDYAPVDGNMARVNIRDDGAGIPKSKQSLLFVPFERLGSDYEADGTGIGLSITESLVHFMDGNIGVESDEGQGANFWFDLPIANTD